MYNEAIKNEYMDKISQEVMNPKPYLLAHKNIFEKVSEYEKEYNKDAYCFETREILNFYKGLFTGSISSLSNYNCLLKQYTEYTALRGLVKDGQNHYEEIDSELLETCLNRGKIDQEIITRQDLLKDINELLNPSDKFLVLGIFEGLGGVGYCDFWDLTLDNFDENKIINLKSGREFAISGQLVSFAETSAEEFEYYKYNADEYESGKVVSSYIKLDLDDPRIIKLKPNMKKENDHDTTRKTRRINSQLKRIEVFLGSKAYGSVALKESGRIEYIKEIMRKENIESPMDAILKHRKEIMYRYGKITSTTYLNKYGKYF